MSIDGKEMLQESDSDNRLNQLKKRLSYFSQTIDTDSVKPMCQFGPKYKATSSAGIETTILTMYSKKDNVIDSYLIVAVDKDGQIIGYRDQRILSLDDELISNGFVYTFQRGKGIANIIDAVNTDFIQRASNHMGRDINWSIFNSNEGELFLDEITGGSRMTEERRQKLVLEQKRWQSLYGDNGRFNTNGKYDIQFIHDEDPNAINLKPSISIKLARNDRNTYTPNKEVEDKTLLDGNKRIISSLLS